MSVNASYGYLARVPLLQGLDGRLFSALSSASRVIALAPHEALYSGGSAVLHAHALVSGTIRRFIRLSGDSEKVIELVSSSQMIDMGELFSNKTYSSFAEALLPCTVVAIDAETFRNEVWRHPELSARVIRALALRQCAVEFDVVSHAGLPVVQRVLDYLLDIAGDSRSLAGETTVRLEPSKRTIASRIGISPETLSRALRSLSEAGLIVVERLDVHIQNAALQMRGGSGGNLPAELSLETGSSRNVRAARISPASLINVCGRLRMLSQRIAIAWNMLGRRIAPVVAQSALRRASVQFEQNLARLDGGGLSGTLGEHLDVVKRQWLSYRHEVLDAEPSIGRAARVFEWSESLLEAADRLTAEAASAFSGAGASLINVAGRNRMLSQRMVKLFVFCDWGADREDVIRRLDGARDEFAANLEELRRASAGVPELAAQLREIAAHWTRFDDEIRRMPATITSARHVRPVLQAGEQLLRHVDTMVKLYERLAD